MITIISISYIPSNSCQKPNLVLFFFSLKTPYVLSFHIHILKENKHRIQPSFVINRIQHKTSIEI